MKQIFLIYFLLIPLAYSDYFSHPGSKEIIDELIETYNFDEEYVNPVSYTHLTLPTIYSV